MVLKVFFSGSGFKRWEFKIRFSYKLSSRNTIIEEVRGAFFSLARVRVRRPVCRWASLLAASSLVNIMGRDCTVDQTAKPT
jgi:hypothetical protein